MYMGFIKKNYETFMRIFFLLIKILVHLVCPDAAVVGSLGSGEAALGPAKGVLVLVQDGVLLLDAEPRVLVLGLLHDLVALLALVGLGGRLVVLEGLAEDELVVAAAEGVGVHGDRREVRVRVLTLGLARRGAVVVPDGKLCNGRCPSY